MKILTITLAALPIIATAQTVVKVPSLITGEYRLEKAATIKNQTIIIRGTPLKPAVLALCGQTTRLNDCRIILEGDAKVVLYMASFSSIRRTRFEGGTSTQLRILRSANVTVEDCQFVGSANMGSLVEAMTGHPWQFEDADQFGDPYVPETRYNHGTNRFCHVNPLNGERRGTYDGRGTITIPLSGLDKAFNPVGRAVRSNRWQVWQDGPAMDAALLQIDKDRAVLQAPRGLKPGPFRWQTYNPAALIPGLQFRRNQLVNLQPGKGAGTGISAYSHKLSIIEGCTAIGFADYGLGFEWPDRCEIINNVGARNQEYTNDQGERVSWNDFEMVAPVGPVVFRGNIGNQTEVRYFYAPQRIESDRPVREQAIPAPLSNSADERRGALATMCQWTQKVRRRSKRSK